MRQGVQKQCNLTKQQRRGIAKLRGRTKSGEILITCTDKCNGYEESTMENNRKDGESYVAGDKPVTWKEIEKATIFMMGEDWG